MWKDVCYSLSVVGMVECAGFVPSFDSSALYLVGVRKFVGLCVAVDPAISSQLKAWGMCKTRGVHDT